MQIFQGDHGDWEVTVIDGDSAAINLTSALITYTAKAVISDTAYVIQKQNEDAGGGAAQIEMTDPTNGKFEVHFLPADTTLLTARAYIYDIEVTLGGKVKTVLKDRLIIKEDVT